MILSKTDYQKKYLKYKKKYFNSTNKNMTGGAFPFKQCDGTSFNIMIKIDGDTLERINERRIKLGLSRKTDLHITLIAESIITHIKSRNVIFDSTTIDPITNLKSGIWEFLGRGDISKKYWARV